MTKELERECEELGRSMITHGWTVMATMRGLGNYIAQIQAGIPSSTAFNEAQTFAVYETRLVSLRHAAAATEAVYKCIQCDAWQGYLDALRHRGVTEAEMEQLRQPAWALSEKGIPTDQAVICLLAELEDLRAGQKPAGEAAVAAR